MPGYEPPFTMTEAITNHIIDIGELVGKITTYDTLDRDPVLRRENRIKTIHSSLAIENNILTLQQVSAVIGGKRVLAPPKDIREVQNAYDVYEKLTELDPYSMGDLLFAHSIMMQELAKNAGKFRTGQIGVYDGEQLIHAGSPAKLVPELMSQLFDWLKTSKLHPLVKSCIFHYEFEFIHPFEDGNGRTGRLWQSQQFFAWLPVETLVHEKQSGYYDAIAKSDKAGESTVFVEFMLSIIKDTLQEIYEGQQYK